MWMMENNVKGMSFDYQSQEGQTYLWNQITRFICESKGNAFNKIVEEVLIFKISSLFSKKFDELNIIDYIILIVNLPYIDTYVSY